MCSSDSFLIPRRAPEKVKEVVIDFKKKIVYDPTKDNAEQEASTTESAAVIAIASDDANGAPAEEVAVKSEQQLAEEADRAAIASVLLASAAVKKKRRKHKFTVTPLPLVPCVQFRGLSGRSKQNMAMMQSFATLFKMVSQSFGNRDVAFKMGVAEEVSVIVTVCQAMPRVLDYYMWIIDALYRDGFGEISPDELDVSYFAVERVCTLAEFIECHAHHTFAYRLRLKITQWCFPLTLLLLAQHL